MTWIELAKKQVDMFSDNHLVYCELLVTANAPRLILNYAYGYLNRKGLIMPIEAIPQSQKHGLMETANEFSKGRLDREQIVQLVKSLYAIEYFLNQ